jgi:hypothetical protein
MRSYSAGLSGCVFIALVLAGSVSAAGRPGGSHAGGDNATSRQAARAGCKSKGLRSATDGFKLCVNGKVAGKKRGGSDAGGQAGDGPGGQGGNGPGTSGGGNQQQRPADEACNAKPLKPGGDAFRQCAQGKLGVARTPTVLAPKTAARVLATVPALRATATGLQAPSAAALDEPPGPPYGRGSLRSSGRS